MKPRSFATAQDDKLNVNCHSEEAMAEPVEGKNLGFEQKHNAKTL